MLAHRHLGSGDRSALERDRRALELIADQLEVRIDVMLQAHERDVATSRRLAAWRRYLSETRSRVNEALTRPVAAPTTKANEPTEEVHITAPQGLIPTTSASESVHTGPIGTTGPIDAAVSTSVDTGAVTGPQAAEPIVEHLRAVRSQFQNEEQWRSAALAGRGQRVKTLLWIQAGVAAAMAVALIFLPPGRPPAESIGTAEFSSVLPLTQASRAGQLLIATVDPSWITLDPTERRLTATRLMTLAEGAGCTAGLLLGPDGQPLASWSPGRSPRLYELPASTAHGPRQP
jgi:hypothetical protein